MEDTLSIRRGISEVVGFRPPTTAGLSIAEATRRVGLLDLEVVTQRMIDPVHFGWSANFADLVEAEYRRWSIVVLCARRDTMYIPAPVAIYRYWHEHMIFSGKYRADCYDVLQVSILNWNYEEAIAEDPRSPLRYYADIGLFYERLFGHTPEPTVW